MVTLTKNVKLQVLLSGAASSTESPITVAYEETNKSTNAKQKKMAQGITTGGTAVDILAAPAASVTREVQAVRIPNADNAAITVTVRTSDLTTGSAVTRNLNTTTLQVGDQLCYDENSGWYVMDSNGRRKSDASTTSSATSDATSVGTSAATRASVSDSKALSVSTLASTADSKGVSAGTAASVVLSRCVSRAGC